MILRVRIQGLPVILVNYYATNGEKEQVEVLTQMKEFLSKIEYDQNIAMICSGDFNVIFYKSLDADGGNPTLKIQSPTKIHTLTAENELCDIFRLRHPGELRFTWRRKNRLKQRRLDYFLISDSLQDSVSFISISSSVQSDHSTIVLKISPVKEHIKGASYWKFNNSLLNDKDFVSQMKIKFWSSMTKQLSCQIRMLGGTMYQIRMSDTAIFIENFNEKAKQRKAKRIGLESRIKELESSISTKSDSALINEYNECKQEQENLYDYITQGIIITI